MRFSISPRPIVVALLLALSLSVQSAAPLGAATLADVSAASDVVLNSVLGSTLPADTMFTGVYTRFVGQYAFIMWTTGARDGQSLLRKSDEGAWEIIGGGSQMSHDIAVSFGVPDAQAERLLSVCAPWVLRVLNPEPTALLAHGHVTAYTVKYCGDGG